MNDQLEQISKEKNFVNFDDDDDKFFSRLDPNENKSDPKLDYLEIEKNKLEKKNLKHLEPTEAELEPIRKNLYIESKELSQFSEKEVAEFRKKNGDIKVRGIQCPKPIRSWYQCGLPNTVTDLLERKKFKQPFPIQCQAIPAVMSGRDVIGIAETGSGKTLAYLLPMIRHIRD